MATATKQTIEAEVAAALKVAPKEDEPRSKYLARLARLADKKLSDAEFSELSQPAQEWINNSNKRLNASLSCNEPDPEASKATDTDDDDEEEAAPKGKAKKSDDDDDDEADADDDDDDDDEEEAPAAKKSDDDDDDSDDEADADDDDDDDDDEEPKAEEKPAKKEKKEKAEKPAKKEKAPKEGGRERKSDKGATDDFCRHVLKHPDQKLEKLIETFSGKIHKPRAASVLRSTLRVLRCQGK